MIVDERTRRFDALRTALREAVEEFGAELVALVAAEEIGPFEDEQAVEPALVH
jgi:hypothetical protein